LVVLAVTVLVAGAMMATMAAPANSPGCGRSAPDGGGAKPGAAQAGVVQLAGFGEDSPVEWRTTDDPVMGGKSSSTIDVENGFGWFQGNVRVVPSLGKPGFCNLEGWPRSGGLLPDASSAADKGGLVVRLRHVACASAGSTVTEVRAQLGTSGSRSGAVFTTAFKLPQPRTDASDASFVEVVLPWSSFELRWRGRKQSGGPGLTSQLASITSVGLSVQPAEASAFSLQVAWFRAVPDHAQASAAASTIVDTVAAV